MNSLEFKEVIKTVDATGNKWVYSWNDLEIYFFNKCAFVEGFIPYEVAKIIYNKYHDKNYGFSIGISENDCNPDKWARDVTYDKEINSILRDFMDGKITEYEKRNRIAEAEESLEQRNDDEKFIKEYSIGTKEGFLLFLDELKDYYLRLEGKEETEVKKFPQQIEEVKSELSNYQTLGISAADWANQLENIKDNYLAGVQKSNLSDMGKKFREAVDNFDRAVNPFLNDDVELDDIDNISACVQEGSKYHAPYCNFEISDYNGDYTEYVRNNDGFVFHLEYTLGQENYMEVKHELSSNTDNEEILRIDYYGDEYYDKEGNKSKRLEYNMTSGTFSVDNVPATGEQISFILNEINNATEHALGITMKNKIKNSDIALIEFKF